MSSVRVPSFDSVRDDDRPSFAVLLLRLPVSEAAQALCSCVRGVASFRVRPRVHPNLDPRVRFRTILRGVVQIERIFWKVPFFSFSAV